MAMTAIAIGGLVLSGVSTVAGMSAQSDSARAQRRAQEYQRRMDELRQNRERRQAIREQRIKTAQVIQAGANQGAVTSSAVQGGSGSLQSQLSSNLSFLDSMGRNANLASQANQQALNASSRAQNFGAMAGLGGTIFSAAGGFGTIFNRDIQT